MSTRQISTQDALKIYHQLYKLTATPMCRLILDTTTHPSIYSSKLGGLPYWDLSKPYPTNEKGEKLMLLAQINMEQIPPNDYLPHEGMLQIFIDTDDMYGCDFCPPEKSKHSNWKIIYHPFINSSITIQDITALDVPTSLTEKDGPIEGEIALGMSEWVDEPMSWNDARINDTLRQIAQDLHIELPKGFYMIDLLESLPEQEKQEWDYIGQGSKLLGYPAFVQGDPRDEDPRYNRLLLQIDSDFHRHDKNYVMWGDSGVGNFFIKEDDLKKWNLESIWYNWDCG